MLLGLDLCTQKFLISGVVKISYSKDIFFIYKVNLSVKM